MSKLLFIKRYLNDPKSVGGIAPSSSALAEAMVEELSPDPSDLLIELGPGTGVFTEALIATGMPQRNILLVERDPKFATMLHQMFPHADIAQADARHLKRLLHERGLTQVRQILSGLPFRSLPPTARLGIASAVGQCLAPGGVFVQFSYFPVPPLPSAVAARYGLIGRQCKIVLRNAPPAFVWKYCRRVGA
jgi:phosphatidylethanolamine/phosphatidyl-N-methylethanolamine N-methyltransferase